MRNVTFAMYRITIDLVSRPSLANRKSRLSSLREAQLSVSVRSASLIIALSSFLDLGPQLFFDPRPPPAARPAGVVAWKWHDRVSHAASYPSHADASEFLHGVPPLILFLGSLVMRFVR